MKGDFTRLTFRPNKHYNSVRMQQGRVQTDADWNEWDDIKAHLQRTEGTDVIGMCGVPRNEGGFEIGTTSDNLDLTVSEGRIYVDGILCELEAGTPVTGTAIDNSVLPAGTTDLIEVPVLTVDGLAFEDGQWVEVDDGVILTPYKIAAVDTVNSTVTLDGAAIADNSTVTLRRMTTYYAQPEYHPAPAATVTGTYLAYLDVWERHVTALEDPAIREVALGGPDTATRKQTVRQLKLLEVTDPNPPNSIDWTCWDTPDDWTALITAEKGRMRARAEVPAGTTEPCIIPASAGYRGLENQLYRVEIHTGGAAGTATFKWSRDNGIVVSRLIEVRPATFELLVGDAGKDQLLGFAPGQWVEVTDEARTLRGEPGILVQLSDVKNNTLVVDPATWSTDLTLIDLATGSVRRWDQQGTTLVDGAVTVQAGVWIELEDGVQVYFEGPGDYTSGDYWQVPARVIGGDVEWPLDTSGAPLLQLPHGIEHHYCRLALVDWDGSNFMVNYDCRPHFPALTEPDLYYVSGDGQEAMPGKILPQPLRVGVVNCNRPVEGAWIKFEVIAGLGKLKPQLIEDPPGTFRTATVVLDATGNVIYTAGQVIDPALPPYADGYDIFIVPTDDKGEAQCDWQLEELPPETDRPDQLVEAVLLTEPVNILANKLDVPVLFGASFGVAWQDRYGGTDFPDLQHPSLKVYTVEKSLDQLRENTGLYHVSGDGQEATRGTQLPQALQVRVANGRWPRAGATVRFEVATGNGSLFDGTINGTQFDIITDADGVAQVWWTPDGALTDNPSQQATATLIDPVDPTTGSPGIVRFNANLSIAEEVTYDGSAFPDDQHPALEVITVEAALDQLRENTGLHYVSGDGQEGSRGAQLPQPLQVRVANGRWPRAGATVRFEVAAGNGSLFDGTISGTQFDLVTDADGVAQVWWTPDGSLTANPSQQAMATLIDPVDPTTGSPGFVRFNANLSIAEEVTYDGSAFPDTQHPALEVLTVEEALDQLRENTGMYYVSGDGQEATRGTQLPQALQVRVANGRWPRAGATVRFEVAVGNGSLFDGTISGTQFDVVTDVDGIAQVWWTPDGTATALHSQQVTATLIDPVNPTTGSPGIVRFNANLSIAEEVSYDIHAESTPGVATVQAALDDLYTIKLNRAGGTITGSLVIQGDLTVNGTTTTLNTATLEVEDNIIRVNTYPAQPVPLVINGGLEVFRGGTEPNAQIIWDETADQWQFGLAGSLNLSVDALGNISGGSLSVTSDITAAGTITGASLSATSDITAAGSISGASLSATGDITAAGNLNVSGSFLTSADITWNAVNTDWASIYFESTGDAPHLSNLVFETFDNSDEGFIFRTTGIERARIDDRGVIVPGDIAARSKQMLIDHPTIPAAQLVHAALDGPEFAVYYRGEATLDAAGQAVIILPAYFEDLTDLTGRTVLLTAQGAAPFAMSASVVSAGQFTAYGVAGGAFAWEVKAVRKDIGPLVVVP